MRYNTRIYYCEELSRRLAYFCVVCVCWGEATRPPPERAGEGRQTHKRIPGGVYTYESQHLSTLGVSHGPIIRG